MTKEASMGKVLNVTTVVKFRSESAGGKTSRENATVDSARRNEAFQKSIGNRSNVWPRY